MKQVYAFITFIICLIFLFFNSEGYPQGGNRDIAGPSTYHSKNLLQFINYTGKPGPFTNPSKVNLFSDTGLPGPSTFNQVELENPSASLVKRSVNSEKTYDVNEAMRTVISNINKKWGSPSDDAEIESVVNELNSKLKEEDWTTIQKMINNATTSYDYKKLNDFEKKLVEGNKSNFKTKLGIRDLNNEQDINLTDKNVKYKYIPRGKNNNHGDLYRLNSREEDYNILKEKLMETELPFDDQNFFVKSIEEYNKYMPFMVNFKTNLVINILRQRIGAKHIGQFTPAGYSKMCTQNDDCTLGTDRNKITRTNRILWFTLLDIQSAEEKFALYILGNRKYHFNNDYYIISKNRKKYAENSNKEFEKHFFSEGISHDESVKQTKEKVINKFIEDSKFSMASVDHYDKILHAYTVSLILNTVHDDISVSQYKETNATYNTFNFHKVFHMLPTLRIGYLNNAVFAKVKAAYCNNRGIYKVEYDIIDEKYVYDGSQNLPELIYTDDVIDTNIDPKIKENIVKGIVSVQSFSEEFRNTPFYLKFIQKPLDAGELSDFVSEFFEPSYDPENTDVCARYNQHNEKLKKQYEDEERYLDDSDIQPKKKEQYFG